MTNIRYYPRTYVVRIPIPIIIWIDNLFGGPTTYLAWQYSVCKFTNTTSGGLSNHESKIDILITTDVLGVGQNLQDSRVLVNYDLHWNPMKMEQRIGRIDRITTQHDELLIYNFVPTGNLKEQLGLMERIQEKIQDIARTFGHAAPILDTAEEQVHKTMMTYERLDQDGAQFGDERLEGIGQNMMTSGVQPVRSVKNTVSISGS